MMINVLKLWLLFCVLQVPMSERIRWQMLVSSLEIKVNVQKKKNKKRKIPANRPLTQHCWECGGPLFSLLMPMACR